jgi:hypothetical protein
MPPGQVTCGLATIRLFRHSQPWGGMEGDYPSRVQDNLLAGSGITAFSRPFEFHLELAESGNHDEVASFERSLHDLENGIHDGGCPFPG